MTTLLTMFAVIGLIAICYAVGKYNKSDNLFWILLVSLLAGMAGGAIVQKCEPQKNENVITTTQVCSTQVLPAQCVDLFAVLGEPSAFEPKPVSQNTEIPAFGSSSDYAPSKSLEEIRGQPPFISPLNKGTPGMPFDTS